MHAGVRVNVTVYLGWITLLLVGGVLAVSAYGVMADALTLKEFLAQWMPIATLSSATGSRGGSRNDRITFD